MKSKPPSDGSPEVGYAKPPKHCQFKPGQSGNPSGRPTGSKNRLPSKFEDSRLRTILSEEADRIIIVQEANGEKKQIKTKRAIVRSIAVNALKGQPRAQQLFMSLLTADECRKEEERVALLELAVDYKRLWGPSFKSATPPKRLPHPDHVLIDLESGNVTVAGPLLEEERPIWERWRKIRSRVEEECRELREFADSHDFANLGEEKAILIGIYCAEQTLTIIDLALAGSRRVMAFLQKLDLSTIEEELDRKKRWWRLPISSVIYGEMNRLYRAETGCRD